MSAPSKALNLQSVKIRSMQSLTNSIEPATARQAVTNVVKPVEGTYQAATQVKVLSPVILHIIEADVFHSTESSMNGDALVSHHALYRGLSPWHDMRWKLSELGRALVFFNGLEYVRTSRHGQELTNDAKAVGLADSTRSLGKPSTGGSGQQCCAKSRYCFTNTLRLECE
ncbi:hypothetical protein BOW14_12780 [Solemya velum gill symbiont]|nr:hypothetical protein BOW14_12780 [Solemya velum gill symbiont]